MTERKNKNFNLGKRTSREFNLSKGGSVREFNLSKDDGEVIEEFVEVGKPVKDDASKVVSDHIAREENTVKPIGHKTTKKVTTSETTAEKAGAVSNVFSDITESAEVKNKSAKWVWILVIAAFLCILLLWLLPRNEGSGEGYEEPITEGVEAVEGVSETENHGTTNVDSLTENTDDANITEKVENNVNPDDKTAHDAKATGSQIIGIRDNSVSATNTDANQALATKQANSEEWNYNISEDIEAEALNVIRGKYGNNPERREILGSRYSEIQNRVNEILE